MPDPKPKLECDLIMKGGITSGVVYPKAVITLSDTYRFKNIGGTSAGAISAVVTAAAEHARQKKMSDGSHGGTGFPGIADIPVELGKPGRLGEMFQPLPVFKPLYQVLRNLNGGKVAIFKAVAASFWKELLQGAAAGLLIAIAGLLTKNYATILLGLVLAALCAIAWTGYRIVRLLLRELPRHDYGICTGLSQPGHTDQALTDWLSAKLDDVSGEQVFDCSHAEQHGINTRTVTTDLTTRRPYTLPIDTNTYFFSKTDFLKLFPAKVVERMSRKRVYLKDKNGNDTATPVSYGKPGQDGYRDDFYYFQDKTEGNAGTHCTPMIVLARLSLSFPFLFCAVPLYRFDYSKAEKYRQQPVRCLFSDGGLSSNFPVHFFDQFLPHTPTFGISLTEFDEERLRPGQHAHDKSARIHLPTKPGSGLAAPTFGFDGLAGFIWALFSSAKDWQDTLQSALPGYRERIVTIALKPSEGGLNLDMNEQKVEDLMTFGELAGNELKDRFCLDEHRWRRFLVETAAIEDALGQFAQNYKSKAQPGCLEYGELVVKYAGQTCPNLSNEEKGYQSMTPRQRSALKLRTEQVVKVGHDLGNTEARRRRSRHPIPKSPSRIRNIAKMGEDGAPASSNGTAGGTGSV